MTVAELEAEMGAGELNRWALFESVEPFPAARVDLAAGIIASVIANVNRKPTAPAFEPLDFMPIASRELDAARTHEAQGRLFPAPEDDEDAILQRLVATYYHDA